MENTETKTKGGRERGVHKDRESLSLSPIVQKIGRGMEDVGKSRLDQTPSWHRAQYQAQRAC